jgi:exodeoxyribonuclease VII large subunit
MNALTLGELAGLIKSTIQSSLNDEYWVTAEIAQINYNYNSGHCYLDLAEKQNDATTAKMRAAIWASNFRQINNNFRTITGQELQSGMKILMLARVNFHEVHGLSLNIRDIDPRYTLGEMALKRRQIIERLTKEGIIDKNRQLDLPPVLQKIAVISSMSAAGYGDFQSRLNNNPYGYRFYHRLFQAHMQGEKAEESIGEALKKCIALSARFEVIVIIRGGGSIVDLHCFDSYPLAKLIALSPLPVFTGIGHERDETVIDRVANQRLITPTAVAEFLIYAAKKFEDSVDNLGQRLIIRTNTLLEREKHSVNYFADNLKRHAKHYFKTAANTLKNNSYLLQTNALAALKTPFVDLKAYEGRLKNSGSVLLKNSGQKLKDYRKVLEVHPWHMLSIQSQKIEHYETKIGLLDPHNILSRGYSITFLNGKILKGTGRIRKGDIINTRLHEGAITSIVESTGENEKNE